MFNRLKNTLYAGLIVAGALGFSYLSGCSQPVEPIKQNQKPIASFIASPKSGTAPLNVSFDGGNSRDPDGTISKYIWEFGDGNTDSTTGAQVNYNYTNAGNYASKLSVRDNQGMNSDKALENIVVDSAVIVNQKPVAQFTTTPTSGNVPLTVNFNGNGSYDSDGTISKYIWELDDGNTDSTSGAQVNYIYQTAGNKTAGLTVEDNQGARSAKTLTNIVINAIPSNQIAFWSNKDAGTGELYSADLVGDSSTTNTRRLTFNQVNDISPYFSPDGTKIVFASNRADATGDGYLDTVLWIMEANGSNPKRITPDGLMYASWPFWAQNNKIYFNYADMDSSFNITSQGIAVINPDGTGFEKLISEQGHNWLCGRPTVSPDGSKMAFVTDRDNNLEIYDANIDGTNQRNLTNSSFADDQPMFSPDGNELLFISNRGNGSLDILVMNADGSNVRSVTNNLGVEVDPVWSSDGKYILFAHDADLSDPRIYIASSDGKSWKQLTSITSRYPAWRPKP